MKQPKRALALLLALVLAVSLFPMAVFAEDPVTVTEEPAVEEPAAEEEALPG